MTPWVTRLIVANIVMFFVEYTLPGLANALVFVPALVFSRPWSIVTYMFLHDPRQLTHILEAPLRKDPPNRVRVAGPELSRLR